MTRTKPRATAPAKSTVRCAIYTRKSTEDGLQQEFNSLDAQRDAGENYIRSQEGKAGRSSPTNTTTVDLPAATWTGQP